MPLPDVDDFLLTDDGEIFTIDNDAYVEKVCAYCHTVNSPAAHKCSGCRALLDTPLDYGSEPRQPQPDHNSLESVMLLMASGNRYFGMKLDQIDMLESVFAFIRNRFASVRKRK